MLLVCTSAATKTTPIHPGMPQMQKYSVNDESIRETYRKVLFLYDKFLIEVYVISCGT